MKIITTKPPALQAPTVSVVHLNFMLESAREMGAHLDPVLQALGLDADLLADLNQRAPLQVEQALYEAIMGQLDDTLFGLHMGEKVRPTSAGALGYATMSSRNLGEAVGLMLRFERFRSEVADCDMTVDDDTFSITWTAFDNRVEEHRHRVECAFSSWVNFGRWITRSHHNPVSVSFRHTAPSLDITEYQRIFDCPVVFNADANCITLNAALLDIALADADPDVNRLMQARIEQMLQNYKARGNFLATVKLAITQSLANTPPTLESLATEMNIKPWTFRRRLSAEGADFSSLLDQTRIELAQHYLSDPRHSISDIAYLLGYSEQSALNRAFKRWFDCSPAVYRQRIEK